MLLRFLPSAFFFIVTINLRILIFYPLYTTDLIMLVLTCAILVDLAKNVTNSQNVSFSHTKFNPFFEL